jgi:hypothetical protein
MASDVPCAQAWAVSVSAEQRWRQVDLSWRRWPGIGSCPRRMVPPSRSWRGREGDSKIFVSWLKILMPFWRVLASSAAWTVRSVNAARNAAGSAVSAGGGNVQSVRVRPWAVACQTVPDASPVEIPPLRVRE